MLRSGIQIAAAHEADRAVAHDREPPALKIVGAAHRVHGADQPDDVAAGRLPHLQIAADGQVHGAEADRRVRDREIVAANHEAIGHRQVHVHAQRIE